MPPKVSLQASLGAVGVKTMQSAVGGLGKLANLKNLGSNLVGTIEGTASLLKSIIVVIFAVGVLALIYILWKVVRLRGFSAGHSEDFGKFMDGMHADIDKTRKLTVALSGMRENYGSLLEAMQCPKLFAFLQQPQETIKKKIDTYFKYCDISKSKTDRWFYSNELAEIGEHYLDSLVKEVDAVRKELGETCKQKLPTVLNILAVATPSKEAYEAAAEPHTGNPAADAILKKAKSAGTSFVDYQRYMQEFVDLCIGFGVTNLYFNVYYGTVKDMHNSRRFSFFNFLIVLLKPYVNELIFKKVVDPFKELFSSGSLGRANAAFARKWDAIRKHLVDIPNRLVNSPQEEKKPKEKKAKKNKKEQYAEEDTIEGFGFLKGLLSIGEFFTNILMLAIKIAQLISRPFEMVMFIIKLVVGIVIGITLLLLHTLLSLPPFNQIVFGIYFFVAYIVIQAIVGLYNILLFAVFAVFSAVLWALDLILGGFRSQSIVAKSMRCENPPDAWFTVANVTEDNVFSRSLICKRKCSDRFAPSADGWRCEAVDKHQPSFCPQAQIYRIYKGLPLGSPESMAAFTPSAKFWSKTQAGRKQEVEDFYVKRQEFFEGCSKSNAKYDDVARAICVAADYVRVPNEEQRAALKNFCKQSYCYGSPAEPFCTKFKDAEKSVKKEVVRDAEDPPIEQRVAKLATMLVIAVIIMLMFLYNSA